MDNNKREALEMRKAEVEAMISKAESGLSSPLVPENLKGVLRDKANALKSELAGIESEIATLDTTPAPEPTPEPTPPQETEETPIEVILGTIKKMAEVTPSANVDASEIERMIREQLQDRGKISLSEISEDLKRYIDKHQLVEITIPSYGLKISMDSETAEIENIFKIIDDVLAGNNVYLIGEAGTGKTYTAEKVAQVLDRNKIILNCSQYTSPTEILGGQTIEGYVDGKLIIAWRDGGILILDEMPKLDPNTAGLFNDALAKSSKTRPDDSVTINSANPKAPAIPRNPKFGVIATGNIYPNAVDMQRYVGNNQQDLSLLDRFSGSVYFVGYSERNDQMQSRYKFLYDLLVGDEKDPSKFGFRHFMVERGYTRYAVLSLRTIISMRVSFEIELVREMARRDGKTVVSGGKTLWDAIQSFLVAFPEESRIQMVNKFNLNKSSIDSKVRYVIDEILKGEKQMKAQLTEAASSFSSGILSELTDFKVAQPIKS